jgi:hypothetical protein
MMKILGENLVKDLTKGLMLLNLHSQREELEKSLVELEGSLREIGFTDKEIAQTLKYHQSILVSVFNRRAAALTKEDEN